MAGSQEFDRGGVDGGYDCDSHCARPQGWELEQGVAPSRPGEAPARPFGARDSIGPPFAQPHPA